VNPVNETDLGREVRAAVAAALKRFGDNDIAALKVSTLKRIDAYLNPEPDTFTIPKHRTDAAPYEAMQRAAVERMQERA
jgi:hypothetical protein